MDENERCCLLLENLLYRMEFNEETEVWRLPGNITKAEHYSIKYAVEAIDYREEEEGRIDGGEE